MMQLYYSDLAGEWAVKKLKRSARLVEMTQYLLARPHTLISLTAFAERYQSAKSSISEDLAIIKEVFEDEGIGELNTLAGAAGGVRYVPKVRSRRWARSAASLNSRIGYCRAATCI